ncbi:MAG: T9SS type A sorting domain-containing protein [Spirochaetes bacterium]|nr:T9SS type A sorting domain-containing protein [Spirochaetota bacterium]
MGGRMAWGDYDNDGNLDLVVAASTNGILSGTRFRLYLNNNGTFTGFMPPEPSDDISGSVAWADYDNDGDLDLAVIGWLLSSGQITCRVYKNNGLGGFSGYIEPLPGWGISGTMVWVDFDNDGDLDLSVSGDTNSGLIFRIFINDGSGSFTNHTDPFGWGFSGNYSLAWGDYDNDGDQDLAMAGTTNGGGGALKCRVYRNDGFGNLSNYVEPEFAWGVWFTSVAWGDYDNDGYLDLAVMGQDVTTERLRVFKNNQDGTFNGYVEPKPGWGIDSGSLAWGDLDNDGDLDLAVSGYDGSTRRFLYFENNNDGTFNTNEIEPEPGHGVSECPVTCGDFDNDGDLDIAAFGFETFGVYWFRVYKNTTNVVNNPPNIPAGLKAMDVSGYWRFSWSASSDDHSDQNILQYQIAIGTNQSGRYDYTSDIIHYPQGQVNIGNVPQGWKGSTCYYQSKIPVEKKAYWKVCAIDSALKSSGYSGEQIAQIINIETNIENCLENVIMTPNPFNPSKSKYPYVTFFHLPDDIKITIYDILNKELNVLRAPDQNHRIRWDIKDSDGQDLPRGVYIVHFKDGQGRTRIQKIVIQR